MGLNSLLRILNTTSSFNSVRLLFRDFKVAYTDTRRWAIMGKKSANAEDGKLRHIKYREKIGGKLPVPGVIELLAVGNGSGMTPKGLVVNTSHFKYLFNCGEGMQRIASEHKMKLSRIEQIFITHQSWDNVGGLMGLCLTLESAGVPTVTLHGPPNVEMIVSSARTFAQLRSLQLVKREVVDGEFEDSAMKVEYVPIFPNPSSTTSCDEESAAKKRRLSDTSFEKDMAIIYICKPHAKPRTVSLELCVELDIPVGPHLALLKEGQEATLPDGRLVKPDDVLYPAEVAHPFLIVDCPSEAYLESLVTNVNITKYQSDGTDAMTDLPCLIVHFTPASVFKSSAYQVWMSRFKPETRHLILNELGSDIATEAVYEIQAKLNLLHPQIFPLLPHQTEVVRNETPSDDDSKESVIYGQTNLRYTYRGKEARQFVWQDCVKLDNEVFVKEVMSETEFKDNLKEVQQNLIRLQDTPSTQLDYPEILFLGTGSSIPNKVRNVSAVWVSMTKDSSILLDCGENTFGQIYRNYISKTPEVLRTLKAVFISHLHADHHLGIIALATERHRLLSSQTNLAEPLTILAPGAINAWYKTLHSPAIPIIDLVRVIPLENFYESRLNRFRHVYSKFLSDLDLREVKPVFVRHRQFPHGLVLTHKNGWKLTYSGDTMPSEELIEAGRGSDVLIHEATMEDFLADDAAEKRHSTTSQAIEVGVRMNAKFILLTHFSQRYAKVPVFNESFSSRVGIAFDNMRVRLGDLPLLPLFVPALKSMFADQYLEMEEKTEKKRRQKERKQCQGVASEKTIAAASSVR